MHDKARASTKMKKRLRARERNRNEHKEWTATEAETFMETEKDSQYKCMNRQSHISCVRIVRGVTGVSACVRDACMF